MGRFRAPLLSGCLGDWGLWFRVRDTEAYFLHVQGLGVWAVDNRV